MRKNGTHRLLTLIIFFSSISYGMQFYSDFSVLHITFHKGCDNDFQQVAQKIGLNLTSWYLHDAGPTGLDGTSCGNAIYNISAERAERIWQGHKDFFNQFDVIVTSDTAPLARVFLQHNWKKPLIVWICNRFDYFDVGTYDKTFPDSGYYTLIRKALTQPNIWFVPYTDYEWFYALRRGVHFPQYAIRPLGTHVKGKDAQKTSPIPKNVERKNTIFIHPRIGKSHLQYVAQKCAERGIETYSGVYNGPDDLTDFKAVLFFPYAWSNVALFENIHRGIIHFVPSVRFVLENITQETPMRIHTDKHFEYCDWYRKPYAENFIYFDSWDDLKHKTDQLSDAAWVDNFKKRIMDAGKKHEQETIAQWTNIFDSITHFLQKKG